MRTRRPLIKLDQKQEWIDHCTIGFGFTLYTAWNRAVGGPVGFVWGYSHTHSFDVFGSYVEEQFRRQGVRTRINAAIFADHETIKTWDGSKTGGAAFLKAAGYRWSEEAAQWWKKRSKVKKPRVRS